MFKRITEDAILPTRGSKYSACVDVYANEDVTIGAGETKLVGLGIAIDNNWLPSIVDRKSYHNGDDRKITLALFHRSHYLQLMIRSSLAVKGLMLGNGVGIIDLDFEDELKMIIYNPIRMVNQDVAFNSIQVGHILKGALDAASYVISKGERIGQLTLLEHKSYLLGIESEDERNGGFGSTNKKENK